jgi:CheY-like chemotaxis protein
MGDVGGASAGKPGAPAVVVVEDDEHIAGFVAEVLEDDGYTVATAANGQAALALLDGAAGVPISAPALILLDWNMPVMDGPAFLAAYRQRPRPHAPVVIMTASRDAYERCKQVGATDCLGKPFDLDDLLACVTRLTNR